MRPVSTVASCVPVYRPCGMTSACATPPQSIQVTVRYAAGVTVVLVTVLTVVVAVVAVVVMTVESVWYHVLKSSGLSFREIMVRVSVSLYVPGSRRARRTAGIRVYGMLLPFWGVRYDNNVAAPVLNPRMPFMLPAVVRLMVVVYLRLPTVRMRGGALNTNELLTSSSANA